MRSKWTICVRAFSVCTFAVILSACQGGLVEKQQFAYKVGFHASGVQTRTTMSSNGLSAVWESGDKLALWARNSAGNFTLQNQKFESYGLDGKRGFFTSVLAEEMPEDMYTYFCTYPVPVQANGSEVTFNVPSVQDGKVSGGTDFMISTPTVNGPLTALPAPDDHSNLSLEMNRMMHQFRFYVPEEDHLLGNEKIERICMSFPTGVTGNVSLDLENPNEKPVLKDAQTDVTLELAHPIGVSKGDAYEFACLAFVPVQFAEGQSLLITKAYTDNKIAFFDPIDLKGKNCMAGHSTPVKLNIRELLDYAGTINVTLGVNNLGENPRVITLTAPAGCKWGDGGSNVFVYNPGREIQVGETVSFKFETDFDAYKAFSGQSISVSYDSDNALMSETLTMPSITQRGGSTSVSLTVPYLLFEDFSCIYAEGESYGNNSYSSSETTQPGESLDACMRHTGWNAARYWAPGNSIRINTRYQCVKVIVQFASSHYGRLDTPKLTGLKSGRSVNLNVIFDAGGYTHTKSSLSLTNSAIAIATHTNTGVLDGIPTGTKGLGSNYPTTLADFGTTHDSITIENNYGDNAFNDTFPTREAFVMGATSACRLCFYPKADPATDKTGNFEFNVYIDNIKVQIAK